MKLSDLVTFRKDLLFHGAVQIGWYETDHKKTTKAAENFVFHGPEYHGVRESDFDEGQDHYLQDTATFTADILERLSSEENHDEPFALAIAGWGTGKSHLGLTLATLLSSNNADVIERIISNIKSADNRIGSRVNTLVKDFDKPYLVVAINGMQDFELVNEITRQVFERLHEKGIDTSTLEDLRPRFKKAANFVSSFYESLESDFKGKLGNDYDKDKILDCLKSQDENVFTRVSEIYEEKMGEPIRTVGHESLQQFLRVTKQTYCGPNKQYKGIMIIFDEFGRYLEFAVQKPHVAGSGGLQQLFEAVQENADSIFLLCFIQYELKAYMSRVAPEHSDALNRYVSRYESVKKVRLSTNLETLLANLLEKKDQQKIEEHITNVLSDSERDVLMWRFQKWFTELKNHKLWNDPERFSRVIQKGCWPLHPSSTWLLYKLSSAGKSLQQRSAFSLLENTFHNYEKQQIPSKSWFIYPTDLCTQDMIGEFLSSEKLGQQGAVAHAFETASQKYQHDLEPFEKDVLKAILIAAKIGLRVQSSQECNEALSLLSGLSINSVESAINKLVKEYGVVEWNDYNNQYNILGDALPRRAFFDHLQSKSREISSQAKTEIFAHHFKQWIKIERVDTDFGLDNKITSQEWHYSVTFSNVSLLESHIDYAFRTWHEAIGVDEERGQLIYCYIGPESNLERIINDTKRLFKKSAENIGYHDNLNAPIAVIFIDDNEGVLGKAIAEYWILTNKMTDEDRSKFSNFILDKTNSLRLEIQNQFRLLEKERHICAVSTHELTENRIKNILTELFAITYKKLIPFPFDGFNTARGNAAKDCRLFTAELFSRDFNQNWVASLKPQQKNRSITVFNNSWQVFSSDGSIRKTPGNKSINDIIKLLDSKIKEEKSFNLGVIIRNLCRPPYGCNIASAGLVLGIFVAPRKHSLLFTYGGVQQGVESWIGDTLEGNFFNPTILEKVHVCEVSQEVLDEWEDLFNKWESEETYRGLEEYLEQVYDLRDKKKIPPGSIYRFQYLEEKSRKAIAQSDKRNEIINEQLMFSERAYERANVGNLSRCGAELIKLKDEMKLSEAAWTRDQFEELDTYVDQIRQAARQFFPQWLPRQMVIDPKDLGKYKHDMLRLIGGNLEKLELLEEKKQLEKHVDKIASDIEKKARIKVIVDEVRMFLIGHTVSQVSKVKELTEWLDSARELAKSLNDAKSEGDIPQIEYAEQNLDDFQRKCQEQLKAHKNRANAIWEKELTKINDIIDTTQEIQALIIIYDGKEQDLEDFQVMQRTLSFFKDHYYKLSSNDFLDDEIKSYCETLKDETRNMLGEDAEIPWDIDSTYQNLLDSIFAQRGEEARIWMDRNLIPIEAIMQLDARSTNQLRQILQSPPSFINSQDMIRVSNALDACNKRLDDLEIEGLIEMFRGLSENARQIFLERVKEMMANVR